MGDSPAFWRCVGNKLVDCSRGHGLVVHLMAGQEHPESCCWFPAYLVEDMGRYGIGGMVHRVVKIA